ncbi:hypothetical protein IMY05_014G0055600 [Salix suchowensis]|nr:hypothetical protein IMY05_014G0055600 [Salix suchowensis]
MVCLYVFWFSGNSRKKVTERIAVEKKKAYRHFAAGTESSHRHTEKTNRTSCFHRRELKISHGCCGSRSFSIHYPQGLAR